jgi:hypothetical protein
VIHWRAVPDIPKLVWRRFKRIEWSMVSKAALRSRETRIVDYLRVSGMENMVKGTEKSSFCGVIAALS